MIVGGRDIRFYTTGPSDAAPHRDEVTLTVTPAVLREKSGDQQSAVVAIQHAYAEPADLMVQNKKAGVFQNLVVKLAQKCRAAGIYLVMATQRPSTDVLTGLIKANFPARISFKVGQRVDSQVILDSPGAEALLGRGDAILQSPIFDRVRFQSMYIDAREIINRYGTSNG